MKTKIEIQQVIMKKYVKDILKLIGVKNIEKYRFYKKKTVGIKLSHVEH